MFFCSNKVRKQIGNVMFWRWFYNFRITNNEQNFKYKNRESSKNYCINCCYFFVITCLLNQRCILFIVQTLLSAVMIRQWGDHQRVRAKSRARYQEKLVAAGVLPTPAMKYYTRRHSRPANCSAFHFERTYTQIIDDKMQERQRRKG